MTRHTRLVIDWSSDVCFFFTKKKTAYEIGQDWSSDVCSSDLPRGGQPHPDAAYRLAALEPDAILHAGDIGDLRVLEDLSQIGPVIAVRGNIDERASLVPDEIGRASCRERV